MDTDIKSVVRERYGEIAQRKSSDCGCGCSGSADDIGKKIGYSDADMQSVPEESNLGLGCGNPVALASLKEGEVVLDLGSGAGFDCFLAARQVGPRDRVIGVDMTAEMLEKARSNAAKGQYENVEFRLGEIENLPVADNLADVIISNCVINLSPDKSRVFAEAYRALKPGGRLMISDIVLTKELPDFLRQSIAAYVGCIAGALMRDEYLRLIGAAGFTEIKVIDETAYPVSALENDPTSQAVIKDLDLSKDDLAKHAASVVSLKVSAVKPHRGELN